MVPVCQVRRYDRDWSWLSVPAGELFGAVISGRLERFSICPPRDPGLCQQVAGTQAREMAFNADTRWNRTADPL
ncbi:hypothetical protein RRG08_032546 [Elysia crispata]|uniref:Uncharacterized protein n=1 Tax=Elysia crispata TaxID=231223 RepID=A0AAE0ZXC5_9GAST|nr:hypothetical protein RRG08_032546 [Elysia crispata]